MNYVTNIIGSMFKIIFLTYYIKNTKVKIDSILENI